MRKYPDALKDVHSRPLLWAACYTYVDAPELLVLLKSVRQYNV